jgi:hypothetical protein
MERQREKEREKEKKREKKREIRRERTGPFTYYRPVESI